MRILGSVFLIGLAIMCQAQDFQPGFKGHVSAGFSASQIAGDDLAGFHRLGAVAGIGAEFRFKENMSIGIDLLYNQIGSAAGIGGNNPNLTKIVLDYADIPILFNFRDKKVAIFHGGITVGRLVRYREFAASGSPPAHISREDYADFDYRFTAGVTFLIQEKYGIQGMFGQSLRRLGEFDGSRAINNGRFNNTLSFRGTYFF